MSLVDPDSIPAYGTPPGSPVPAVHDAVASAGWAEVRTRGGLMAFDGRILEVFDDATASELYGSDSLRFHVSRLRIKERRDRKGRHRVLLESGSTGRVALLFDDSEWPPVGAFLSRVAEAAARARR